MPDPAKKYSYLKYSLAILDTLFLLALLFLFAASGLSKSLAHALLKFSPHKYVLIATYSSCVLIFYFILDFPLNFYHSYFLEHKFSLSRQSIPDWLQDQVKSGVISYLVALIVLGAFYYLLGVSSNYWWLWISLFWIFFSIILTKLVPIIIIPLFFKYQRLADQALRERIMNLAQKMRVKILDCYQINFSAKSLKGNAAFVGIGKSRRVILADTLKDRYSLDEIEVILAHEFAHYKLRHLLKLILVNSGVIVLTFYLLFKTSGYSLGFFGLASLTDIASLPVILIYFLGTGIITQPLGNYISRRLERNADKLAIQVTGLQDAFISMMEKLSQQNLADIQPHPLIKFYFFDHPPVNERILMAQEF